MTSESQDARDSLGIYGPNNNWTEGDDYRSNTSAVFKALADEVERLIRSSARDLISGDAGGVARLIMAHLAHRHGMVPGFLKRMDGYRIPCSFPECSEDARVPGAGRLIHDEPETGRPKPAMYCNAHASTVAYEGFPEYTTNCPNCGCRYGIGP